MRRPWILALLPLAAACSVKWQVLQPDALKRVCSVAVVPIGTNKSQQEYAQAYLPEFKKAFRDRFGAKLRIADLKGDIKVMTWDDALAAGQEVGADVVVGLLIDDGDRPPRRMEILNVVKVSNGKILARQNRLIGPSESYGFGAELDDLGRILECHQEKGGK